MKATTCTCGAVHAARAAVPNPARRTRRDESTGKAARAAIQRDIAREYQKKERAKVAELRAQLRAARGQQKSAIAEMLLRCRAEREAIRVRAHERKVRALAELRDAYAAERLAARATCSASKDDAHRATDDEVAKARAAWEVERQYQARLKVLEQGNRARVRSATKRSSAERRSESDDEVRANLSPEFHALFERVKRSIKAGPRETRTEAFLKYVEEHPREALAAVDDKTEQLIRDLERREREASRTSRRTHRPAAVADVPF